MDTLELFNEIATVLEDAADGNSGEQDDVTLDLLIAKIDRRIEEIEAGE